MAYKAPAKPDIKVSALYSAVTAFRALVEKEFSALSDKDLAGLLDERVRAAIASGSTQLVDDAHSDGDPTTVARFELRTGPNVFAVIRDDRIISVIDAETARLNRARGTWKTYEPPKPEQPQAPAPASAPPAVRLGWARDQWMRDPSISVTGQDGMIRKLQERFGAAASTDSLYKICSECRAEHQRRKLQDQNRAQLDNLRASMADLAPALAEIKAPAPESAANAEPVAPTTKITWVDAAPIKPSIEASTPRRIWPFPDKSWSEPHHRALIEIVKSGERAVRAIQKEFSKRTDSWRNAGAIMLRLRPFEHELDGIQEIAHNFYARSRETKKLREARAIREAEIFYRGEYEQMESHVLTETALLLVGSKGRMNVLKASLDSDDDSIVWSRAELVEIHHRIVKQFGNVSSTGMLKPAPRTTDDQLDEIVFRQIEKKPGIAMNKLNGATDRDRVIASVDRLAAAGRIARCAAVGSVGVVLGPAGWSPPERANRARAERPMTASATPAAVDAPSGDGIAEAITEVYRALRAKEIDAPSAAELIRELKRGG